MVIGTAVAVSPELGMCLLKVSLLVNTQRSRWPSPKPMATIKWQMDSASVAGRGCMELVLCKNPIPSVISSLRSKCQLTKPEWLPGHHFDTRVGEEYIFS